MVCISHATGRSEYQISKRKNQNHISKCKEYTGRAASSGLVVGEVKNGEFFVELGRGFVIRSGGVDFVLEISQVFSFAVAEDCGTPQALFLSEPNALISRAWVSFF